MGIKGTILDLTRSEAVVWVSVADSARSNGGRFDKPQRVIREQTGLGQRTVASAFRSLREIGVLRPIATPGPPKSVVYEVREPPVAAEW